MTYAAIVEIAQSGSLYSRVVACVAGQDIDNPHQWTQDHMWQLAAQPGWADDWKYAKDTGNVNVNPDTGARDDVISDDKILAAVQSLKSQPAE